MRVGRGARFDYPTVGLTNYATAALLDGVDLRQLDEPTLRSSIVMVTQESFLFSNTVAANIAFGNPHASRDQIEQAARAASARDKP